MRSSLESFRTLLLQCVFGLALFGFSLMAVRRIVLSGSSHLLVKTVVFIGISIAVLAFRKHYWAVASFLIFSVQIPYIRFSGAELGGLVLCLMFAERFILKRNVPCQPEIPLFQLLAPYVAWVFLIWCMNPCGLFIFGFTSIGFRFYLMIAIGLISLFILSQLALRERDAHILFWTALGGALFFLFVNSGVIRGVVVGSVWADALHYEFLQMRIVAMLLLCRFPLKTLLTDFRLLICIAGSCFLCLYSGNRTASMTPLFCAAALVFIRKKERSLFVALSAFLACLALLLALGHGHGIHLPQGFQKSLSFLPGNWDDRWANYGFHDEFREDLSRRAWEEIREHPWTGRRGFAIPLEEIVWVFSRQQEMAGHAMSGNWHNLWLGMSADFGVPGTVLFAFFYFSMLVYAYRRIRLFREGSWAKTMYLFFFIRLLLVLANSFFSGGHSAKTPAETFLWVGFLVALVNGRRAEALESKLKMARAGIGMTDHGACPTT